MRGFQGSVVEGLSDDGCDQVMAICQSLPMRAMAPPKLHGSSQQVAGVMPFDTIDGHGYQQTAQIPAWNGPMKTERLTLSIRGIGAHLIL